MEKHDFPKTRGGITRKVDACGFDLYLTVNAKPDGEPGEVFVKIGKQGSTVAGMMQAVVVAISTGLRNHVPWQEYRKKLGGMQFMPMSDEYTSMVDAVVQNVDEMVAEIREQTEKRCGQKRLEFRDEL